MCQGIYICLFMLQWPEDFESYIPVNKSILHYFASLSPLSPLVFYPKYFRHFSKSRYALGTGLEQLGIKGCVL